MNDLIKVVFGWHVKPELQEYFLEKLSPIAEITFAKSHKLEDVKPLLKNAEILVSGVISDELLSSASFLKLLVIPYIGVERHVPIIRNFPHLRVINARGNAVPTAQHALGLLLAVTNHIVFFDGRMRSGQWRAYDDSPSSVLLHNKTVGVLGTGTVGREVFRLLSGFTVKLIGCSRRGRQLESFPGLRIYPETALDEFLRMSEVLIVTVPRTDKTDGMIGTKQLAMLPRNAILVTVARGQVISEKSLFEALKSRQLSGAGLDVWYNYQPEEIDGKKYPYTEPFHELDNVVLSPHRAGSPLVRPERFNDIVDNIHRWVKGEKILFQIDPDEGY